MSSTDAKVVETTPGQATRHEEPEAAASQPRSDKPKAALRPAPSAPAKKEAKAAAQVAGDAYAAEGLLDSALGGSAPAPGFSGIGVGGGGGALRSGSGSGYGVGRRAARPSAPLALMAPAEEQPRDLSREGYAHIEENGFVAVRDQALSTFSIDVDTASYSNVRRFLRDGALPPIEAVRIEELVNYFDYDYPAPAGGEPFSIYAEVSECPWNRAHQLVHLGIQGRAIDEARVPARNLVFLIDVSGSMQDANKLPLLKRGLALLTRNLRPQDRVSMVVYAGASGLVLPSTSGRDQRSVLEALERLEAGGSTNGGAGIELAYHEAQRNFIEGGINRVILATDGDFNVGVTSEGGLVRLIEQKRKSGVFLTVLGFGTGNVQDSQMEMLADKGNGNYAYIDTLDEANKVLVREAGATLVTIAKDVKLQVEFNPAHVASYRLVGYENRALAARDFNDDKKDAGEIGAGHTVTALYEIVPAGAAEPSAQPNVDALRYQEVPPVSEAAHSNELLTVKVRYKAPDAERSELLVRTLDDASHPLREATSTFRFSAAVAGFGMLLRHSEHKGTATLGALRELAEGAIGKDPHGDKGELLDMMRAAARLGLGS